ncbi:MCE family protein [Rhodococcus antarcticus]|uniref:MCE family protein n=1 Tax=Rhodococcus antarcticus TaxID=2987751 RepID=A0ABY6P0Y7_9NOCA|nr:MCE family protein [Rhodococcus antarcticus]UZJ25312.1 MCE family protein [Rhodococcus antarcticus]
MRPLPKLVGALAAVTVLVSGCGVNLYDVPLPGGADTGSSPYRVKVQFADVLDLVPQSAVKVDDVPVGRVESVNLAADGWTAEVTVVVNSDVKLPENAAAALKQSSLLGEKFIDLSPPTNEAPTGSLHDGDVITVDRTQRSVELEEAFGALSLLLNGGGVAQLQSIVKELNKALAGNEPQVRSLLDQLNTLVSGLDDQKSEISRALDSLNTLTATVNAQRGQIANALDQLPQGLQVLSEQEPELTQLLTSLQSLGAVATDVITKSKDSTVADLQALTPTLQALAAAGSDLPNALQILGTYPFTDQSVQAIQGSQTNLYINADLQLGDLLSNLTAPKPSTATTPPRTGTPGTTTGPSTSPALPNLPALPTLPTLPTLPGLPGLLGGTSGGTGSGSSPAGSGGLGGLLGGLMGGGS